MKKLIALLVLLSFILTGLPISASAQASSAKVISYSGNVDIFKTDSVDAVGCAAGMKFKTGDRIKTGAEAYVEMAFDRKSDSIVRVEENSNVVLMLKGNDKIELIDGEILTRLQNMPKGTIFQVRTPSAVCGARGTGWGTKAKGGETTVSSFESTVFVRGVKKDGSPMEGEETVKEGHERKTKKFEKPGKETKVPEKKLEEMKGRIKFPDKKNKRTNKRRRMGNSYEKINELKESILDKKDKKRIEKVDKKEESSETRSLEITI